MMNMNKLEHKEYSYSEIGKRHIELNLRKLLRVYSKKGTLEPTKLQIAFRELVYIFFELVISFYTVTMFYGIPVTLLASLLMVFFTNHNQSFHDLCCSTIVVDEEPVQNNTRESDKIYLTIIEEDKEDKK